MAFLDALRIPSTLFHVSGIPVRADRRWFGVLGLLAIAATLSVNALMGSFVPSLIFGAVAVTAFVASIFIHKYAHAFAANMKGSRLSRSYFTRLAV